MSNTSRGLRPFRPQTFGRYTLLNPLATGGMGAVYLARMAGAEGFQKLVVIKKILPQLAREPAFVERFLDEARMVVQLQHGSIAQILDMGCEDGQYYIAIEFVDGKDLRKIAARARELQRPMPPALALFILVRVLDALAYAHRKKDEQGRELNLVHRDISPQNVIVSYEGEVKVIDFGLAKSAQTLDRTRPHMLLGKFFYMAPEQVRHQPVDRRVDLYAAGICLWELLAGKNPFDEARPQQIMRAVASPDIARIRSLRPELPESLEQALLKALAVDPGQRFATAEEMRGRLSATMLELDTSSGPESLAALMHGYFGPEYESERRMIAALARVKAEPADPASAPLAPEAQAEPAPRLEEGAPTPAQTGPDLRSAHAAGGGPRRSTPSSTRAARASPSQGQAAAPDPPANRPAPAAASATAAATTKVGRRPPAPARTAAQASAALPWPQDPPEADPDPVETPEAATLVAPTLPEDSTSPERLEDAGDEITPASRAPLDLPSPAARPPSEDGPPTPRGTSLDASGPRTPPMRAAVELPAPGGQDAKTAGPLPGRRRLGLVIGISATAVAVVGIGFFFPEKPSPRASAGPLPRGAQAAGADPASVPAPRAPLEAVAEVGTGTERAPQETLPLPELPGAAAAPAPALAKPEAEPGPEPREPDAKPHGRQGPRRQRAKDLYEAIERDYRQLTARTPCRDIARICDNKVAIDEKYRQMLDRPEDLATLEAILTAYRRVLDEALGAADAEH
jgi:serine/threonine-protein kinase